jgi:DNA-binding XRE family transcriptional regulator
MGPVPGIGHAGQNRSRPWCAPARVIDERRRPDGAGSRQTGHRGQGRSQGALAADAGILLELISRIENGAANPELDTLGKIAAALGVHPGELLKE